MKTLLRGIATLLTAALLCFNLFYEMAPGIVVGPEKKLVFAAAFAILLRIAMFCGIPDGQRPRRRRLYMQLLLYYYMWVLANVLFFDNAFGRGFTMHATLDAVNLEPLRTIRNYLLAYGYGNISLRLVVLNLAGNVVAFAPMGVFLPAVFRWQRSIFFFTATLTLAITAVEVAQVYTEGVYLGFYTYRGRKFPHGNFRTSVFCGATRCQNTSCRRNRGFATG